MEARAFADSDRTTSELRLGPVLGRAPRGWRDRRLLAQERFGRGGGASPPSLPTWKVRDVLLRGDEVTLWKVTDIAEFLGVSTQRVDQLALAGDSPHRPAELAAHPTGSDRR